MYFIAPSSADESNYATWVNGFSESEITNIINLGESFPKTTAVVGSGSDNISVANVAIRKSEVSWIEQNERSIWLYDKVAWIVRQLNGQNFRFDLTGFAEPFQYTTYYAGGSHYDWHIDKGNFGVPRKLSVVIQLTDPSEYEGGDLEFLTNNQPLAIERQKGLAVVFPSWLLHRVTPVTKGTRRSLVVWTGGPAFR